MISICTPSYPPTLCVTWTNHSRMEYIESRLSNRAAPASTSKLPDISTASASAQEPKKEGQEILQGHLMEIDLSKETGPRDTVRNEEGNPRVKRQRLGRDGKPWRPRNRRGSDAIKRDQLVEEILRENRRKSPTLSHTLPRTID